MKNMKPRKIKEEEEEKKSKRKQPTYFFKLMVSPSEQSIKLRIPKKFARTRRNELSSPAILTVPTGETRKVELVEENNDLWFRDGWEDFVEYFSIGLAYFMLIEYEGNSKFKVNIFDLTGFEISYPCNARSTSQVLHEPCYMHHEGVDYSDDNDSKEHEIMHTSSFSSKASDVQVIELSSEDDECVSDDEVFDDARECTPFGYPLWLKKYAGLINVVTAAGIPLPNNPFFVAAIKEYVLCKFLNIPKAFGQGHLRCEINQRKSVKLEAYDGRQWNVDCVRDKTKYIFRQGWINFARQIRLEVGDVCVFEVTNSKKYVLRVHVVKNSNICRVAEDTF